MSYPYFRQQTHKVSFLETNIPIPQVIYVTKLRDEKSKFS